MRKEQLALWQSIATFKLDDPDAARPFSKKLEEENKWTEEKTLRVIAEYKKFLFLCVTEPDGASPSPIIDEAWHLHLTYTESYWGDLCKNILKTELHHKPSKGGFSEIGKHQEWYRKTLIAYINAFGYMPPEDIWEYPIAFHPAYYLPQNSPFVFQKDEKTLENEGNTEGVGYLGVEIYEPQIDKINYWLFAAFGFIGILLLAVLYPPLLKGLTFLIPLFLLGICISILIIQDGNNRLLDLEKQVDSISHKLSPYIGSWILGGKERLMTTWLYEATSHFDYNPLTKKISFILKKEDSLYQNPLYSTLQTLENQEVTFQFLNETLKPYNTYITDEVKRNGYEKQEIAPHLWGMIITFGLLIFTRFLEAEHYNKPSGFLIMTGIIFAIVYIICYFQSPTNIETWRDKIREKFRAVTTSNTDDNTLWLFAMGSMLFSSNANLYGFEQELTTLERENQNGSSGDGGSSSCGSGDGGSGCGGGCGGCGGS